MSFNALWDEFPIHSPVFQDHTLYLDDALVEEVKWGPVGVQGWVPGVVLPHVALDDEVKGVLQTFLHKNS